MFNRFQKVCYSGSEKTPYTDVNVYHLFPLSLIVKIINRYRFGRRIKIMKQVMDIIEKNKNVIKKDFETYQFKTNNQIISLSQDIEGISESLIRINQSCFNEIDTLRKQIEGLTDSAIEIDKYCFDEIKTLRKQVEELKKKTNAKAKTKKTSIKKPIGRPKKNGK